MLSDHDCVDNRVRAVHFEGDDFYTERCSVCGKFCYEGDGIRIRAWMRTPVGFVDADGGHVMWPWKYVYPDPVPGDLWKNGGAPA